MAKLKTYTLGNHGFVDVATRDALGLAPHVRQARVIAVATTKTDAVRILAERGFPHVSLSDSEFRVARGNDIDALADAGLLATPGVWVMPTVGQRADGVVAMQAGGVPKRIGHLEATPNYRYTFVPEEP